MLTSKDGHEKPMKPKQRKREMTEPNLTPPTAKKAEKAEKPVKAAKPKAVKDPNAPSKPRAPRQNYGYSPDATISIVEGKDAAYRGHRKDWFETLKAFNGKKVSEWVAATKKEGGDAPRGWLRFYVQDGSVVLTAPAASTEAKAA